MDNYTKDYELRVAVLEMRAQQAQLEAQIARVELQQMQIREPLSSEVSVAVQAQPETLTHARSGKHSGKQRGRPPGKANAINAAGTNKKKEKCTLSPAARKAIAAAQKRRWAAYRAASAASGKG